MGFLDQKERVLDVVLTDRGRELLSKNLLEFSFYAFSDEGVNYSGSLSASIAASASFDNYVHRDLTFEADQRREDNGGTRKTLEHFLFTIPSRRRVLPEFRSSQEDDIDLTLKRSYFTSRLSLNKSLSRRLRRPVAVILRAALEKRSLESRLGDHALEQQVRATNNRIRARRNVTGMPLSKDFVAMTSTKALNTKTGLVAPVRDVQSLQAQFESKQNKIVNIRRVAEFITGLDSVTIDLKLKSSEGEVDSTDGFLIEVFESGSDGKLKKLSEKTIEDPINDERLQNGYDSFLRVTVDK